MYELKVGMGYREALIALLDELAVAVGIVLLLVFAFMKIGFLSGGWVILVSAVILIALGLIGYLGGKAQLKKPQAGKEAIVGKKGRAIEPLDPEGIILLDGEYWKAVNIGDEEIRVGDIVEVVGYKGLELHVVKSGRKSM